MGLFRLSHILSFHFKFKFFNLIILVWHFYNNSLSQYNITQQLTLHVNIIDLNMEREKKKIIIIIPLSNINLKFNSLSLFLINKLFYSTINILLFLKNYQQDWSRIIKKSYIYISFILRISLSLSFLLFSFLSFFLSFF